MMRLEKFFIAAVVCLCFAGSGLTFDLQCSHIKEYSNVGPYRVFTCMVQNVNVLQRGEKMTSASTISNIGSVKGLYLYNQPVHYLPEFTHSLAQRLEFLIIHSCHLKTIQQSDLKQFPNLRELNLLGNDFTSIGSNLFEFNPKLEYVAIQNNKLQFIGSNILKPLKNLKRAYLAIECIRVDADTPAKIETLKAELLTKCKNGEEPIEDFVTQDLTLTVAELEKQKDESAAVIAKQKDEIGHLGRKVEELERKLHQQSLRTESDNVQLTKSLKNCDKMLNAATKNLVYLLLHADLTSTGSQTVDIVCENFEIEAKVCEVVDLSIENFATTIASVKDKTGAEVRPTSLIIRQQPVLFLPMNFAAAFPDLEEFELSGSGIFIVDRKSFDGLDKLTNLNLTSNKILNIQSGSFADLKNLAILELSHNNLESINLGESEDLSKLKVFKVNDNKLKEINAKFLSLTKSLTSLDLTNNVCVDLKYPETAVDVIISIVIENCTPSIDFNCKATNDLRACQPENLKVEQPKVKILKVNGLGVSQSSADVTTLIIEDQSVNFLPHKLAQSFLKLQKLVVNRSQLSQLTKDDFVAFADLTWIEVCDNNLTLIHAETFNAVPQLVHLDLSSNRIQSLPAKIFERLTQLKELRLSINDLTAFSANTLPKINAIKVFKIDNNKLEQIDPISSQVLKNSDEIDMSANTCIDAKYQKTDESSSKALMELMGFILFNCFANS